MKPFLRPLLILAFLSASSVSIHAADTAVVPTEGIWWSSDNPGTGVAFNVDGEGRWFAAIYLYGNAGEPTFLTMQGEAIEYLPAQNTSTSEPPEAYARVVSPLIRSEGGQCLECPWTQATASASGDGNATITFYGRNRAELSVGDWRLRLAPMLNPSNEHPDFPALWANEDFKRATDYYSVTIDTETVQTVVVGKVVAGPGFGGTLPPFIDLILDCIDCRTIDGETASTEAQEAEIGGPFYLQSFALRCDRNDRSNCWGVVPRITDAEFIVDAFYVDQTGQEIVLIDHGHGDGRAPGRIELRALPADWQPALP